MKIATKKVDKSQKTCLKSLEENFDLRNDSIIFNSETIENAILSSDIYVI